MYRHTCICKKDDCDDNELKDAIDKKMKKRKMMNRPVPSIIHNIYIGGTQ